MTVREFCHLHVHSEYSLLDGATRIPDLVRSCRDDGQTALALTDHGNLFGAIELFQTCRREGVKPIIGCEVYVAMRDRKAPHNKTDNGYHHLTLLARNPVGYKNLLKLASIAYLEGNHYRPRIDKQVLSQHGEGLTGLSGCLSSEINQLFLRGKEAAAERASAEYADIFGREHFWLEIQRNPIEDQQRANAALMRLSERTGIPLVATNDIHYLQHEHAKMQDVLLCISTGAKRADEKRFRFDTETLYFRSRAEMSALYEDLPQALSATMAIADQVDLDIDFGTYHVPVFRSDSGEDENALFDRLCREGLERSYGADSAAARERLSHEIQVIREMGFVSYFLIVWDLVRWAREQRIPVGPGRGSVAGSIVAYVLGITQIDPLRYGLLFERFLNSARISMPDIDIDFCKEGRERVLQYTRERYGSENVAQIATFGTMQARTAIRDVGRVLDVPLKDVDRIAKRVPAGPGAPPLKQSLEQDADLIELRREYGDLDGLFEYSVQLEGLVRHVSTHAAGVVIADKPIVEYTPLCTHGGEVATQWPAKQLEELGLLKMDYLGLRTLTILERTLESLARRHGVAPDLNALPEDDRATYQLLESGDTLGVFQLESDGMRKLLARLKPDCFEDLIAVLALYRPGPLESGMIDMFIRRKHGEEQSSYPHPVLEPILSETYGCIVYQEQVMLISNHLGGFTLNEADNLRKAMGKKKPEIMKPFAERFVDGAIQNGCHRAAAEEIWDNIVKFGGYGFNKSHSTAYARITYQTAFLKANHRVEFLAANLSCEMGDSDKVKEFIDDARRAGIAILGPDIRSSGWGFEPEGRAIHFGLGAIKGTGQKAIGALLAERDRLMAKQAPLTLHSLCSAVDPADAPRATWEALIKAGAFDCTDHGRGALLSALDGALGDGARAAEDRRSGQGSLFGNEEPSGLGVKPGEQVPSRAEILREEYQTLGFYLSGHPLEEQAGLFGMLSTVTTAEIPERPGQSEVALVGLIVGLTENVVKSGSFAGAKMARFRLEDLHGSVAVTCFPRVFEACRAKLQEDAVVFCRARVEDSEEPGLILEELCSIEEALERFDGGMVVTLEPRHDNLLESVRTALKRHPGNRPLFLRVKGADGSNACIRPNLRVALRPELAEELAGILGAGSVHLARL
jgi:DNA polymerase-3 subunit alpha